ncbi:DgyrCDS3661 [Dimorphilus gyrociliatus]|uniref:DgyrCDS3661 n=1 Tax=Dimorphilus gyrociliatus TaxID=2664684 RepID=A0A7I8VFX6_9ANNE|nr:DgyrCDS3661 [Dimorphilus gyrociliatus]
MGRHAQNNNASSVYTYHERKKDSKIGGYGDQKIRLGKDSLQNFDCCCLTQQVCKNPVLTPDGFLYDKQAILENILHQKRQIARKLKEYEKLKERKKVEKIQEVASKYQEEVKNFAENEGSIISKSFKSSDKGSTPDSESISNVSGDKKNHLPAFWVPSKAPSAKIAEIEKPDEKVRCPMSGKPLKMKNLIDIIFTEIKDREEKNVVLKDARYVCPVTNDVLSNNVACAVLRTSGHVVTLECVEKLIRKDMINPLDGKKLTEKDIIPMRTLGGGFASAGGKELQAKKQYASMQT